MSNIKQIVESTQIPFEAMQEMVEKGSTRNFKTGDFVLRAGQSFKTAVIILSGRVNVSRYDDDGNEFLLYYLETGQACALSIVCSNYYESRGVQMVAETETSVLQIAHTDLQGIMQKYPAMMNFVFTSYRERFEEILTLLNQVVFKSLDERLAFYLKREKTSRNTNKLEITHEQIATHLNSSRVVISRLLKTLEHQGAIKLHRNMIEILEKNKEKSLK